MSATSIPPVTLDEVRAALADPTFTVYVYIGKESDKGWAAALWAFDYLTKVRIYRANDLATVNEWLDPARPNGAAPSGIVFGFDDKVDRYLDKKESESKATVLDAISEAR